MAQVLPDALRVEIGYGSTPLTALSSVSWTDVTASVRLSEGVSFNRGRFGNDASARPGSLSFTLDNSAQKGTAGRFTSGGSKIELRVPVRVRARFPLGGATNVDLWYGYVESVEAGWVDGFRPVLAVRATDRLGRLEKRQLVSLIRGVQSGLGAVAMWPLDDSAGATEAGEQSSSPDAGNMTIRQGGTGGTLVFGDSVTYPGADAVTCALFSPGPPVLGSYDDGKYLRVLNPGSAWQAATSASSIEFFFYSTGTTTDAAALMNAGGNTICRVTIDGGGRINLRYAGAVDIGPGVVPNEWHHVVVTQSLSGTTVTTKAYYDGVEFGNETATVPAGANVQSLYMGFDGRVFSGRMSHVACYNSVLSATQVAANANMRYNLSSYTEEAASAVFTRMCQAAGLPSTEYQVSGTTTATMSPVPGAGSLLDSLNRVATAENGVVYVNRSGLITLAARATRNNPTSAFSVPAKAINPDTSFSTDMNYMVNDVTITRPAGITSRYVNSTSAAAYDTHDQNLTAYLATDNQAAELASRLARVNATPEPRVSDITMNLVTAAADLDEDAILKAEPGTYFQVTNLPTGSPTSTLHLFVEGMQHRVTDSSWQVAMTTTPASEDFFRGVWVLGSASLSQLGSTTVLAF